MSIEVVNNIYTLEDKIPKPNRDIRIYIDTENYIGDNKYQIYLQMEPEAICPKKQYLLSNYKKYSKILTFDKDVLAQCPNAVKYTLYTITWIHEDDYKNIDTDKKKFAISTVVGAKQLTPGHVLRLRLYFMQTFFNSLPFTFYRSSCPPLLPEVSNNPLLESKDSHCKSILFRSYQFHLAIENSKQENYFTEKLIDCLITKTIPIYWGCPNIHEYFDTTGWIILEEASPEEILMKASTLDSNYYSNFADVIERNYKKSLYYIENIPRLNKLLREMEAFQS